MPNTFAQSYDYIIKLIWRGDFSIIPLLLSNGPYIFVKPCVPFAKGCFVTSLVEIGSVVLEREMKKCEKFSKRQTNGQRMDNRLSEMLI